jgi:hypothetical protein
LEVLKWLMQDATCSWTPEYCRIGADEDNYELRH